MHSVEKVGAVHVLVLAAAPMTQSPWTYSAAPMELPISRPLNSSSSESSIDSGFETPTMTVVAITTTVNNLVADESDCHLTESGVNKAIHNPAESGTDGLTNMMVSTCF